MTDSSANERQTVLELRNVWKRFGAVEAVKDASIEVRQGEVLTLLGPSGCGKTTTLRMAIGLERVSSGEILYDGIVVDSGNSRSFVPPNKRNMGMVFQSYAHLASHDSGRERRIPTECEESRTVRDSGTGG